MNFFEAQSKAHQKSKWLVVYFCMAVVAIVSSLYAVVICVLNRNPDYPVHWWNPEIFAEVAGVTVLIILAGSLYKIAQLSAGGRVVAESMGGRLLLSGTKDLLERKVLNVVEEMAIASGMPVPSVYFLEAESGINAFAAGFTPEDSVIGVTRGSVEHLTRDELQGVIAHEFSHILNGDMRLNMRLMGIIFGILVISQIGYLIMRSVRNVSSGDRKGNSALPVLLIGLAMFIIGYLGVFFGNLIKAAVSRQREFLADASAVQFTRNPNGISGALKKIGGWREGSSIKSSGAGEAQHFFFAEGISNAFFRLLSTHPPLTERIRAIDPNFQGEIPEVSERILDQEEDFSAIGFQAQGSKRPPPPVQQMGQPEPEQMAYAGLVRRSIPEELRMAAREPFSACAVVYGLLISREPGVVSTQIELLRTQTPVAVFQSFEANHAALKGLDGLLCLPLAELALPALRQLSLEQYQAFRWILGELIAADQQIELFEYALQKMVCRYLEAHFVRQAPPAIRYHRVSEILEPASVVLSAMAWVGEGSKGTAPVAFRKVWYSLALTAGEILPLEACGLDSVDRALDELAKMSPELKERFLDAASQVVRNDGRIELAEAELLRAVADSIGCPIPPILTV